LVQLTSSDERLATVLDAIGEELAFIWDTEGHRRKPHTLVTPTLLNDLRAAELGIILWHEERLSELQFLRTLAMDGICSNTPDQL